MFTLFLRAVLLYILLIAAMRVLGKRQLGELQPYEFALTILLAELIASPMEGVSTPLIYGLLPVAAVMVVHGALSVACMKSDKLRAFISGKPAVVISRGVIDRSQLDRLCINISDLLEGLRCAGFLDPAQVGTAVIEANGNISAFADSANRPATTAEMQVQTQYEGLPVFLIMDGRIQKNNLRQTGKNTAWLEALLMRRKLAAGEVYLASLDTSGNMRLQLKNGDIISFCAMNPSEVCW